MTGSPHLPLAVSALEARALLGASGSWGGELALLDAALEASGEADPLVITLRGAELTDTRVLALGRGVIALAAHTPGGVRAARYVREA